MSPRPSVAVLDRHAAYRQADSYRKGTQVMKFGWLTLALSPTPDEDAVRIDDQIAQVCAAEALGLTMCG